MNWAALGGSIAGGTVALLVLSTLFGAVLNTVWKEPILARQGFATLIALFVSLPIYLLNDGSEHAVAWALATYPVSALILFAAYTVIAVSRKKRSSAPEK